MASPPTPYPTTTLETTNPATGQRQLRRTPVGLRRMYDDDATISTDFSTDTKKRRRWPFWCIFCLLFLLLFFLAGAGVGIYFAVDKTANKEVPISTISSTTVSSSTATGEPSGSSMTFSSPSSDGTTQPYSTTTTALNASTAHTVTTQTTPPMICKSTDINLDIYVLVDISMGLSSPEFKALKTFLANDFFNQFDINLNIENASRMALMSYDKFPNGWFKFDSINSTDYMVLLINNIRQDSADSRIVVNLGAALNFTRLMSDGSRPPSVKKVILVFISMNSSDNAVIAAKAFQQEGYIIVTVALGGLNLNMDGVASSPQFQFRVTDLQQISQVHNALMNALCDAQKVPF